VSTTEELLERNSSGSGLENREYDRGDPLRWPRDTLFPQQLALTSPTSVGRSVCIVRLLTKATDFFIGVTWYHQPNGYSSHSHVLLFSDISIVFSHICLGPLCVLFPFNFPSNIL
jgi:hypothetical protein